jgi:hypothetical protein
MWGRGPALYKHNYLKKNNLFETDVIIPSQHFLFCYILKRGHFKMCDVLFIGCIITWAMMACGMFNHLIF